MSFNLSDSLDTVVSAGNAISFPTGMIVPFANTTAPDGWIILTGSSAVRTIGNASSGADRANSDTEDLFAIFWNNMGNTEAPVSSGRGSSASADYAANKTITIPETRGRSLIGTGTGSGLTARTHGATGGAETHQLTTAELASHTHTAAQRYGAYGAGGTSYWTVTGSVDSGSTGSDTAHANMQPWVAMNLICKL